MLTINARLGTLVTHDLGVLDAADASFTELERPASGTGIFTQANNVFFISGALVNNGTGFDGELSGELCLQRRLSDGAVARRLARHHAGGGLELRRKPPSAR